MKLFPVDQIRKDFPFFEKKDSFIFFDNAATTQKPCHVIERISYFYNYEVAPVFRGIYQAAEHATHLYEDSRKTVADFIGAHPHEIIFNSGATEGINFIAASWARYTIHPGDEIIVSHAEHNANFVVWQQFAREHHMKLIVAPLLKSGQLDVIAFLQQLSQKTRLVAINHESNVLGIVIPVAEVIKYAHAAGAHVLLDVTQSIPHQRINVHELDADFLVFSGHKMLGPTGIGVCFVREKLFQHMRPVNFGGGMVRDVSLDQATWASAPYQFEAGSPPVAQAIGLAEAVRYLMNNIDFKLLAEYEAQLTCQVLDGLKNFKRVHVLGPIDHLRAQGHMVTFVIDGIHAHDVAAFLDAQKPAVAVSAGKQCAHLVYSALGQSAGVRASFYLYNTQEEVQIFLKYIEQLLASF